MNKGRLITGTLMGYDQFMNLVIGGILFIFQFFCLSFFFLLKHISLKTRWTKLKGNQRVSGSWLSVEIASRSLSLSVWLLGERCPRQGKHALSTTGGSLVSTPLGLKQPKVNTFVEDSNKASFCLLIIRYFIINH